MMKRILVTGATGFVGRPLVAELVRRGYTVRATVREPPLRGFFPEGVEIKAGVDLIHSINWQPLLDGVDMIVHLAGIAHTGAALTDSVYDRINRAATTELAEAAARSGIERLVFVSSVRAQAGPAASLAVREIDRPAPSDAYGRSKLAAEEAVAAAGAPYTVLRPALIVGPNAKGNLRSLMRLAALPIPLPFGAFANRRSLVSLRDFIAAIQLAIDGLPARTTYLVAHPQSISLAKIITALRQGLGRNPGLVSVPPALFRYALETIGKRDLWERLGGELVVDPSRLIAAGWKPSSPIPPILAELAAQLAVPRIPGTA